MNFKLTRIAAAIGLISLSLATQAAPPAAKPYATVNGKAIPQHVADAFLNDQTAQGAPDNEELRKAVREELIRREAIAQAARAKGIDKQPEVQARVALVQQETLIRAFIQDHVKKNPISETALKAEYEKIKGTLTAPEFKSRHILFENEADAKAAIAKLEGGADFAGLAKDSKDPGSKDKGGDLGWNVAQSFVPPFAEALGKLEKGQFTKVPVRTQFGYHVILVEDRRMSEPPTLDQIKDQLTQHLQQQQIAKLVGDIREKAKVE
jgi:peptidyl-prolyl cis-trans isomerase C